ncbi:MAG: secondary thiamine-phosphate synthase enzyme YjbQ [Bacteroidota bacterium]
MIWIQREITLKPRRRGFHLVTSEITEQIADLGRIRVGIAQIFILHTSASLTLNEDASPDVLRDFERHFNKMVPEDAAHWEHTIEGPDDMPAHIKASLLGSSVTVPVTDGNLRLGTWQGIYLCEHRNHGGPRRVIVTAFGESYR